MRPSRIFASCDSFAQVTALYLVWKTNREYQQLLLYMYIKSVGIVYVGAGADPTRW